MVFNERGILRVSESKSLEKIINPPEVGGNATFFEEVATDSLSQLIGLFPDVWVGLVGFFGGQVWLLILAIIFSMTLMADLILRLGLSLLDRYFERKKKFFLESISKSAMGPISFYIWLSGSVLALTTIIKHFQVFVDLIPFIAGFKSTLAIIAVAWFSIRWVRRVEIYLKRLERADRRWDEVTVEALAKIFKLTVVIITALFVLSALGVNLTGLIAFGGMGGIAVGFAAKDIVSNVLGGLMLYLDKPFSPGDWIRSPDKEIEGIVESIGWRITVVRTFDKRPLYIPNGTFSNISIENPSRMTHRRIKETVGIRYADVTKMAQITSDIHQMLSEHPDIASDEILIVNFNQYSASTLDILIYTLTKTVVWVEYHKVKQDVLIKIAEIVAEHGAEMAFPTRTLYVEDSVKCQMEQYDRQAISE